jgi:riboflavin kinase / FMN adenylyltransferase
MTGPVLVLGNFDGVHKGHRAVIAAGKKLAKEIGVPAKVMTFEPHPRRLFRPQDPPFRLTTPTQKIKYLMATGVDEVITLPFTSHLAAMSAEEFTEKILRQKYKAAHIVAGYDFEFGHGRGGNMVKLAEWLHPHHIGVTVVSSAADETGEVYSSTRIRALLQKGDVAGAADLLGAPFTIEGVVEKGDGRGRTLSFPTANISMGDYIRPAFGVYAARARKVSGGAEYLAAVNIGCRPSVGGTVERLEAHLLDFQETIYGQEWMISLHHFIRAETKFPDLAALRSAIAKDVAVVVQRFWP